MSIQQCLGRLDNAGNVTAARYAVPQANGVGWSATETSRTQLWGAAGTLKNLYITLITAPGGTVTTTFTLRINGVSTAVTLGITGSATTGQDITHTVAISQYDRLTLLRASSAAAADTEISVYFEFEPTNPDESSYGILTAPNAGSPLYTGILSATTNNAGIGVIRSVFPCSGIITGYAAKFVTNVPASNTRTVTIMKNGVAQDGTGGTPNTTITFAAGTGATAISASFSLTITAGDELQTRLTRTDNNAGVILTIASCFEAEVPGTSIFPGAEAAALSNSATQYLAFGGFGQNATEANVTTYGGINTIYINKLALDLSAVLTGTPTRTFKIRKNLANTLMTLTFTSATARIQLGTIGTAIQIVSTDTLDLQSTLTGTPAAHTIAFTMAAVPILRFNPHKTGFNI